MMIRRILIAGSALSALLIGAYGVASEGPHVTAQAWSFDGIFGSYDRAAARRGFQVYREVCAGCHSMSLVSYRSLADLGFSEDEIKEIAASVQVTDGPNDQGEMFERPGRASDRFKAPFPNEQAARAANNGALPPDLSLIAKARANGPDYIYALLNGYGEAPSGMAMQQGMNFNAVFPGKQIAMPQPLADGAVTYADGTEATLPQMSHDVVTFLNWAAEPELEERKKLGIKAVLFLTVLTALFYATKRKIWAKVKH